MVGTDSVMACHFFPMIGKKINGFSNHEPLPMVVILPAVKLSIASLSGNFFHSFFQPLEKSGDAL
jgi:hypothetical protein